MLLRSEGAPASAPIAGSPYPILASDASGEGLADADGVSNYEIIYEPGQLSLTRPDTDVIPPGGGAPRASGTDTLAGGLSTDSGDSLDLDAPTGSISGQSGIEVATATLATVRLYSNELEVAAAACRQSEPQLLDYLSCISDALEKFAGSLEEIELELPEELASVSATIRRARTGIETARSRAESRLAAAGSAEERAAIEADAVADARAAVQAARDEIRIAIELIRADDADLAATEKATGGAILTALETVDIELLRATEL